MRTSLSAVLVTLVLASSLLGSSPAHAGAPRKPVIALLPAAADDAQLAPLGVLIGARASELLEASGKYTELHAKQVAAMADQEGFATMSLSDPQVAAQARAVLGADRVITVVLEKTDTGMNLLGAIYDGKKEAPFTARLPADWPTALTAGSDAVARAVLAMDKGALPAKATTQPMSKSDAALQALGRCYVPVIRQSLGVEAPALLPGEALDTAATDCAAALSADKSLRYAQATLALAQAIVGDDAEASATLAQLGTEQDVFEPYTLARFWLLTRYQSNEAGVGFLRETIKKHPGELVLRSYLGDTLGAMGLNEDALAVWNEFLALAPASAFAQGRVSRSLARLGKHDEAIAAAKKAVELAPKGRDAQLQLASRYVDAGKLDEAIATLKPLCEGQDVRAEHVLRLGWATWLKGDAEGAAKLFQAAFDAARAPAEWRTRGRAAYNLALAEAKRGRTDAAKAAYKASVDTGFKVKDVDASLGAIAKGVTAPANAAAHKESSLFPTDASGEVDPKAAKPAAPKDLAPFKQ
jgi:tetratricopeptide (TPR) repeat protein